MKLKIWAAMLAVYIVWGSTYLAIRFAVETLPPALMASTRFLIPGALLYVWRRLAGDPAPTARQWRSAAVVGCLLLWGGNGLLVWAEQHIASGVAALLIGSTPLWFVLFDALRPGGRRPSWQAWLGVFLGFVGIILLISPADLSSKSHSLDLVGAAATLFGAFLWAVGSVYSRDADLPASPLLGTGMEMLAGGAGLLLTGTLLGEWVRLDLALVAPRSILGLLYLIFFGSLVGFVCYTWLLRNAPTPLVSTYAYVNPLVAIFIGSWLAQEALTPRILLAAGVIVAAVFLINTARSAGRLKEPSPAPVVPSTGSD